MSYPLLLEINTRCWLRRLSETAGRSVTLGNVPEAEFARWQEMGLTHLWLMGVWTTGPRSRAVCLAEPDLQARFRELLPHSPANDLAGSPYAIAGYEVSPALGGEAGFRIFRERLNAHGLKLVLDFIANHTGLDHAWLLQKPEFFVHSSVELPGTFLQPSAAGRRWFAHGRDPYFPPWRDTVQLELPPARNARRHCGRSWIVARRSVTACDAISPCCSSTMSLPKPGQLFPHRTPRRRSFGSDAIKKVKREHPDFLFLAEAYWGLEPCLQALGFDYTYDKRVYDFLIERRGADLRRLLLKSTSGFLSASAHFLENHDERRIAAVLSPAEHRAAALLTLGLPGMRMLYEGQLEGRRLGVPVQFARWPDEPVNPEIQKIHVPVVGSRQLKTAPLAGAIGNCSRPMPRESVVVVQWQNSPGQFDLVVVNLSPAPTCCHVRPDPATPSAQIWLVLDVLGRENIREYHAPELLLELPAHAAQLLRFSPKC